MLTDSCTTFCTSRYYNSQLASYLNYVHQLVIRYSLTPRDALKNTLIHRPVVREGERRRRRRRREKEGERYQTDKRRGAL